MGCKKKGGGALSEDMRTVGLPRSPEESVPLWDQTLAPFYDYLDGRNKSQSKGTFLCRIVKSPWRLRTLKKFGFIGK